MDENTIINPKTKRSKIHVFLVLSGIFFILAGICNVIYILVVLNFTFSDKSFMLLSYIFLFGFQILISTGYVFLGLIIRKFKKENLIADKAKKFASFKITFYFLAILLILNEVFITYVENWCVENGCLLLIVSVIIFLLIGLTSLIAFSSLTYIFLKINTKNNKIKQITKISLLSITFLEPLRYFVNALITINVNSKLSCVLCYYRYYGPYPQRNMFVFNNNLTVGGELLLILYYIITPIYLILLGTVLLINYREIKNKK